MTAAARPDRSPASVPFCPQEEGSAPLVRGLLAALLVLGVMDSAPVRAGGGILTASVTGVAKIEPVASIDVGRRQGIAMGDRVVVLSAGDDLRIIATGEVFILDETSAAVRTAERLEADATGSRPAAGRDRAVVVPASFVARAKKAMPADTTVSGRAAAVGPGGRQVWVDLGRQSGLTEGDAVWIRREDFPIARGRVESVLAHTALVRPRPLVPNAVPDVDDAVDLGPAPAAVRTGRAERVVREVPPDKDGAILKLAGARRDGFTPERQLELFDGDNYVGLAGVLTSSDRLCLAKALRAFCTTQPSVGLRALARPATSQPAGRRAARIFDVREGFVLISAGGADGVQAGQTFAVVRDGTVVARLEVQTVEVDFAGAEPIPGAPGEAPGELKKWDLVVREPMEPAPVQTVGAVRAVWRSGDWVIGASSADTEPKAGEVLRIAADPPVAAIVAHAAATQMLLYVPPGWGRATIMAGQRIERVSD